MYVFKMLLKLPLSPEIPQKETLASIPAPRADQTKCLGVVQTFSPQFYSQRFTQRLSAPPWPGSIVSAKLSLAACLTASGRGIQGLTSQHVCNHSGR